MPAARYGQVTIVGVGLLGGSLGLALKQRGLAGTVVGVGHRTSTLETALGRGAVDRFTLSAAEGVAGADLVVLATPVGLFESLTREAGPAMKAGCILTDVGSTKQAVLEMVLPHVPTGCHFVGSHPLAGSEARGIDAASADLYTGTLVVVVPPEGADEAVVGSVEGLWQALGCRTRRIDAATHDRLLAESSHLPHLAASALVEALGEEAQSLVSRGFLDTTRIASGDPPMWRDIFMTNRDELLRALDRFTAALERMKQALSAADAEAVEAALARAKARRDALLNRRRA